MLHLMLPKFNPCSWKSLGEPKTGCEPVWLLPADSRKHAQRNKDLCPLDINSGNEGRTNEGNTLLYTRCVFTASWKTLFAILRTISNFNLDWEAPTVSPICKIGFAPPHKVLLRFFLRSVSSKTFSPFCKISLFEEAQHLYLAEIRSAPLNLRIKIDVLQSCPHLDLPSPLLMITSNTAGKIVIIFN